jgi:hypothetical protein
VVRIHVGEPQLCSPNSHHVFVDSIASRRALLIRNIPHSFSTLQLFWLKGEAPNGTLNHSSRSLCGVIFSVFSS